MGQATKIQTREIGLNLALLFARFFTQAEHLHYGYWTPDLPLEIGNLRQAQERHSELLIAQIPDGVKSILDVGCGVGTLARRLTAMGYDVECVSPSPYLANRARELLKGDATIHESKFETLQTDKRYDLIIFSESFQYVDLEPALQNIMRLLKDDGSLLIFDFFKIGSDGTGPMGGGHPLTDFHERIARYPFKSIVDRDTTEEMAPNLDLSEDFTHSVVLPMKNLISEYLRSHHGFIFKSVRWIYRKKLRKMNRKYFSGERTAESFRRYKSYRLFLYQRVPIDSSTLVNSSGSVQTGGIGPKPAGSVSIA